MKVRIIISFSFILITVVVDDEAYMCIIVYLYIFKKKQYGYMNLHQMEYYGKVIKIKASIVCSQHLFDLFQLPGWKTSGKNVIVTAVELMEWVNWKEKKQRDVK